MTSTGSLLLPAALITTMAASLLRIPSLKFGLPRQHIQPSAVMDTHFRGASTSLRPGTNGNVLPAHLYGKVMITSKDRTDLQKLQDSTDLLNKDSLPSSFQQLTHKLRPVTVHDQLVLTNDIEAASSLFSQANKIEDLYSKIKEMSYTINRHESRIAKLNGYASEVARITVGEVYKKLAYYRETLDPNYNWKNDSTCSDIIAERNNTAHNIQLSPFLQVIKENRLQPLLLDLVYGISLEQGTMISELEDANPAVYEAFNPPHVLCARARTSYGTIIALDTTIKFADWLKAVLKVCSRSFDTSVEDQKLLENMISEGTRLTKEFLQATREERRMYQREKKLMKERVKAQVERDIERLKKSEKWPEIKEKLMKMPHNHL